MNYCPSLFYVFFVCVVHFLSFDANGKKINATPVVVQDGVVCRLDPDHKIATLIAVTEFEGNTIPAAVSYNNKSYTIERIGSFCVWPKNLQQVDSLILPDGIKEIETCAFTSFANLKYVKLPESLRAIGPWAFAHTTLEKVVFPKSMKVIEQGAFAGCRRLSDINFKNVEYIEPEAFENCDLKWLDINDDKLLVGRDAFKGCNIFFLRFLSGRGVVNDIGSLKGMFGSDSIPWIASSYSDPIDFILMASPEKLSGRAGIRCECEIGAPVFVSFIETGKREMIWKGEKLLPLTDPSLPASREGYERFASPVRIRFATLLGGKYKKPQVLYNGEDITSAMKGDTLILDEGFTFENRKTFGDEDYNRLVIRFVKR